MNYIILETGFQSIYSDVLYNKEKSFNLLKSGHVINVKEVKSFKTNSIIFGNVIRQTSVTSTPYKVKIELDETRKVKVASCECAAGEGQRCKHIGALFSYINNEEILAKTDLPQSWGQPSKRSEDKYKKGKRICDLFPPAKKPRLPDISTVSAFFPDDDKLAPLLDSGNIVSGGLRTSNNPIHIKKHIKFNSQYLLENYNYI